tara:strand:+ start:468 stop:704 length:237 start_codon:yes stop_codon:yes gene_type:complete
MITFENTSILSGDTTTMTFECSEVELHEGFHRYDGGELLQDAFPFLNAGEREFLKTGITPQEWETNFGRVCTEKRIGE